MIDAKALYAWCAVPAGELAAHPDRKTPFRMVRDSAEMGEVMAMELVEAAEESARAGRPLRTIIPCGPNAWYAPFTRLVNQRRTSLRHLTVFHMDECLDWECRPLDPGDPYNFRAFMERHFYGPIDPELAVPVSQRFFPAPDNMESLAQEIASAPVDLLLGGWGQDGHVAYNQARRNPYSHVTIDQLRRSTIRVQENNPDTMLALAQRTYGAAYQFVPPMSITLGMKECLSARKIRIFSDTGAWKQTALRVALFSGLDAEYPLTLLQEHPDALITATEETARHPVSLHPEWRIRGVNA